MDRGPRSWERHADAILGIASAALLMALMFVTAADVVLRYLFSAPLRGAFELTELAMLVLIFSGLPLVSRADEHVTMDFIDRWVGPRTRMLVVRSVHALCAGAMLFLAWLLWLKAGKISGYGDTTDVLKIPVGPFVYFMAITLVASGIIHAWKILSPGTANSNRAGDV